MQSGAECGAGSLDLASRVTRYGPADVDAALCVPRMVEHIDDQTQVSRRVREFARDHVALVEPTHGHTGIATRNHPKRASNEFSLACMLGIGLGTYSRCHLVRLHLIAWRAPQEAVAAGASAALKDHSRTRPSEVGEEMSTVVVVIPPRRHA